MSKRAQVVLGGTLAIAFLVAVATRSGNDWSPASRSHGLRAGADSVVVQSAEPQPERVAWAGGRRVRARAQARRFLRGLLTYEVGGLGPDVRAAFRATATQSLQRMLVAGPRPGPARARARVVSLRFFGPVRGRIKASAIVARRAERSLFEFVLGQSPTGWRVQELYP
jgi:hypothetical protein